GVLPRVWWALWGVGWGPPLPVLPPEVILLPRRVPLNVYDFACWARQTVVPLTVVGSHRPVRPIGSTLDELRTGATRPELDPRPGDRVGRSFQVLDRWLHR